MFCLKAVFSPFLQRSLSLPIVPPSGTQLEMKAYADEMSLPLQSDAK